jgi:hypothetical protein
LLDHLSHEPVGVDPVLPDGAVVRKRVGIHSVPELSATELAYPSLNLAPIPTGGLGLRMGACLFLAPSASLGLADSWQPADFGFHAGGALYVHLRSRFGNTRPLASSISYPIKKSVDSASVPECPGGDRFVPLFFAGFRFDSVDLLDCSGLADLVPRRIHPRHKIGWRLVDSKNEVAAPIERAFRASIRRWLPTALLSQKKICHRFMEYQPCGRLGLVMYVNTAVPV